MINLYTNQYNTIKTYMNMMGRLQSMQMNHQPFWMQTQNRMPSFSPYSYQINNNQQSAKMLGALNSLSTDVTNLKDSSYAIMTDNENSSLKLRTANTSDDSSMSVTAQNGAEIKDYKLQINQLAKAQENNGTSLNQSSLTTATTGVNDFSLTVGGNTKNLSVAILSTDTNEEAIQKVASAINDSHFGVTARTVRDQNTGTVQLELTSDDTGTDAAFSLSDISGNIVSTLGANNVTTQAQDAEYYLDGTLETSQSNSISFDENRIGVTLKNTTSGEETISVKPDTDKIIESVSAMVDDYNDLQSTFDSNADVLKSSVSRNFDSGFYSYQFEGTGITKSFTGKLHLNEDELKKQLDNNFDRTVDSLDYLSEKINDKSERLGKMTGEMLLDKSNYSMPTMNYGMNMFNPFSFQPSQPFWMPGMMFDQYF